MGIGQKGRLRRAARGDRGAAAVEFALISIPLMAIILAIIAFGIGFFWQTTISEVARQGARYGAIQGGSATGCDATCISTMKANIMSRAKPGVNLATTDIAYGTNGDTGSFGTANSATCASGDTQAKLFTVWVQYNQSIFGIYQAKLIGKATTPCGG